MKRATSVGFADFSSIGADSTGEAAGEKGAGVRRAACGVLRAACTTAWCVCSRSAQHESVYRIQPHLRLRHLRVQRECLSVLDLRLLAAAHPFVDAGEVVVHLRGRENRLELLRRLVELLAAGEHQAVVDAAGAVFGVLAD